VRTSRLSGFGRVPDVLSVEDAPVPSPGPGELLLEMLVASINPADLNVIEGKYGELPELPAAIGNEGVGRVAALGERVEGYSAGDLVLPMRAGTWTQYLLTPAREAIRLPEQIDVFQAAMLSANPPSAYVMLEDFVFLQPGDWVVQNAANSAVGRCVIQIAKARELKTLNVVRRPELVDELLADGADAVVMEGSDLAEIARPRLALNAVGGASALHLANALEDRGTLVTYGAMARQPLKIPNGLLIFRNLSFQGFWLRRWKETASREKLIHTMASLACLSVEGRLRIPVHRVYPLSDLAEAVEEAGREARSGKVLLDLRA
jgi:mitochondrial enoyl-[acyl-carrier protein] reductase / trans-2-enoyl-CoA reductase